MNRILSLDLGTTTGWAYNNGNKIISGIWDFTPKKTKVPESRVVRYIKFLICLEQNPNIFDTVVYEDVAGHKGNIAAHIYGGFHALLLVWCKRNNVEIVGIPVKTIKKTITGNGNANKLKMIYAANKIVGREVGDDNEADAVCILKCYMDSMK